MSNVVAPSLSSGPCESDVPNAAADDQTAETWQEKEGDGLHRAHLGDIDRKKAMKDGRGDGLHRVLLGDLNSTKAMDEGRGDGLHRGENAYLSSKKVMEAGHGDGLRGAECGDLSSMKGMEEGGCEGLHRAANGDLSSMGEGHAAGIHRAEHGDLISEKAMEAGHDDGLHRAEHGDLSSMKAMEEGHGDGLHRAGHGDLSRKKVMEEGHGDSLHRGEHVALSSEKAMKEGHGDGLLRALQGDGAINMALEEGHGGGQAETERSPDEMECRDSTPPEPENPSYALASHKSVSPSNASHVHTSMASFGTLSEHHSESMSSHGPLGTHANSAAWGAPGTESYENILATHESGEDVNENIALYDGTLGGRTYGIGAAYGTLGGDAHESSSAYVTSEQHARRNTFANVDLYSIKGQLRRHPYDTISASDNVGLYAQGTASPASLTMDASGKGDTLKGGPARFPYKDSFDNGDAKGNVYDHTTTEDEFGAKAHEKPTAYNEAGGEYVNVNVDRTVYSTDAPSTMNFATKSGSRHSGSLVFTKQSGSVKNLGLALRIGGAIFSLIAFSVMISTNEKRVAAGSTFYVKFSDFQAYNYLAALNLLSFLYSSGQLVLLAHSRSSSILSSPVKRGACVYLCDQMLAYLLASSSSSAATAAELSRHGLRNIWPPGCSTWKLWLFCSKADAAVAMSFMSFLFMLLSSLSSGYHLSKLLGE